MSDLIEKLRKKLTEENYDADSFDEVTRWEKGLAEAIAAAELADHFVIKDFVETLKVENFSYDEILKEQEDLSDEARRRLLAQKKANRKFIDLFTTASLRAKTITEELNKQLNA